MNETTRPRTPIDRFLADMAAAMRRDDRGTLADLRHGFSATTCHRAWPHLAPYCDLCDNRDRAIWTLIGAGYATLAPDGLARSGCGNIGATMRRLAFAGDAAGGQKALESFDGRFRRLLACQTIEELCEHLVAVIRAAKAKGVPVDFRKLHEDLAAWDSRDGSRDVRVEWAKAYWGARAPGKPEEEEEPEETGSAGEGDAA
jgi:CRISPR system Cascade subunit CasB